MARPRSLHIWDGNSLRISCADWRRSLGNDPIFARAFLISLPPALIAAALEAISNYNLDGGIFKNYGVLVNGQVYGVITTLLGFLIVFRNAQAYGRFWEACTVVYQMQAQLFDAASSLVAFCSPKEEKRKEVAVFRHTLVRLLSMLNSLMMAELQHASHGEDVQLRMPVLDAAGLSREKMRFLQHHQCKVEIVSQWIQQLSVQQLRKGIVDVPAPIATRAFQEIGAGVLEFHRALKIAEVPFPNTYITSMMVLLGVHMLLSPICMVALVESSGWAFLLTFISVYTLWALALLGLELDSPFKPSFNRNIDLYGLHCEYNERLVSLVLAAHQQAPQVVKGAKGIDALMEQCRLDAADPEYHESLSSRRLGRIRHDNEVKGVSIGPVIVDAEVQQQMQNRQLQLGVNSLALMEPANSEPIRSVTQIPSLATSTPAAPPPVAAQPRECIDPALLFDRAQNMEYWREDELEDGDQSRKGSMNGSDNQQTTRPPVGSLGTLTSRSSLRTSGSNLFFKDDPKDSAFHDGRRSGRHSMQHSLSSSTSASPSQERADGLGMATSLEHHGFQSPGGTPIGRSQPHDSGDGSLSWRSFERDV